MLRKRWAERADLNRCILCSRRRTTIRALTHDVVFLSQSHSPSPKANLIPPAPARAGPMVRGLSPAGKRIRTFSSERESRFRSPHPSGAGRARLIEPDTAQGVGNFQSLAVFFAKGAGVDHWPTSGLRRRRFGFRAITVATGGRFVARGSAVLVSGG